MVEEKVDQNLRLPKMQKKVFPCRVQAEPLLPRMRNIPKRQNRTRQPPPQTRHNHAQTRTRNRRLRRQMATQRLRSTQGTGKVHRRSNPRPRKQPSLRGQRPLRHRKISSITTQCPASTWRKQASDQLQNKKPTPHLPKRTEGLKTESFDCLLLQQTGHVPAADEKRRLIL